MDIPVALEAAWVLASRAEDPTAGVAAVQLRALAADCRALRDVLLFYGDPQVYMGASPVIMIDRGARARYVTADGWMG